MCKISSPEKMKGQIMAGFCVGSIRTSTFMFLSRHGHQGSRDHLPPQEVEVGGCCSASSIFEARKVGDGIFGDCKCKKRQVRSMSHVCVQVIETSASPPHPPNPSHDLRSMSRVCKCKKRQVHSMSHVCK